MHTHSILSASAAAAVAVVLATSGASAVPAPAAALSDCRAGSVTASAAPSPVADSVRIRISNRTGRACVVDQIPTVTFGDLDGAAQPVPWWTGSAPYTLTAHGSAYAALRTIGPAADDSRTVSYLTVSGTGTPEAGVRFSAASVGAPGGIRVWEPITTLWQASGAAADAALADAVGRPR
jgi:hypothetical protein